MTYDDLREQVDTHGHVAVYLTIPGCGPCHAVRPWVEPMFAQKPWTWIEIDSTISPEIAGQLLVFAHPTLLLFVDGREAARFSRAIPRAQVELARKGLSQPSPW